MTGFTAPVGSWIHYDPCFADRETWERCLQQAWDECPDPDKVYCGRHVDRALALYEASGARRFKNYKEVAAHKRALRQKAKATA